MIAVVTLRHLDIHLKRGDAVFRAGDFEIHIAVVIFGARDVGEDGVFVAFLDQAHGDAAHGRGHRHAGIHQRQGRAADRRHGTGTVGFQNVADHAQGVGETGFVGHERQQGALRQSAVADFAPARAAHEADFAHAERREIVVQHEALEGFARLQQLDALLVVLGAERDRNQRLRFAAREQGRTVGARQNARFDPDLADFVECAAIGTAVVLQHLIAEDALLEGFEALARFVLLLFGQRFDDRFFVQRVTRRVAFELGVFLRIESVGQLGRGLASSI